MATNKQLTARVKLNTTDAEKKLKRLSLAIDAINKAVGKQTNAYNSVNAALGKNSANLSKVKQRTDEIAKSANKVNTNFKKTNHTVGALGGKLKWLASTYLGVMGIRGIATASDTVTKAENKFNNLNGNNQQLTQQSMDKIYSASIRSRSGYGDMLSNVSRNMALAGNAFGGNVDNAIRFQEIMAKSYAVGGASAAEQSSSMYQLVQALGSGVLQGDELRSVREGAPIAYKKIEEFARGVYDTEESLKELASQGKITSDIVVAAIMDAEQSINDSFENSKVTFEQTWTMMMSTVQKAFEPALQALNKILRSEFIQSFITAIGSITAVVGKTLSWILNGISNFLTWCEDNWSWLSRAIMTALLLIGTVMAIILFPKFIAWIGYLLFAIQYYGWLTATAVMSALKTAAAWAIANWQLLLIILVIVAVITAVIWMADSFEDACGMIVGGIMTAVAFVYNLIIGVINGIIQAAWSMFAEPFLGIIEWILNACNGGFNSFGDAVANLIGQVISWFLSLGKVVTKIIDAIFGSDWTSGLESLQDKVLKWGKNENAITVNRDAPTIKRWAYSDAYSTGYDWGSSGANWISNKLSGLTALVDPNNSGLGDVTGNIGDIKANTDAMKDSMDLRDDDLEFLRRVAEMEWRNEFTTAEIKVDMTNNNSISSERDWEGMLTYLSDALREEMVSVADGVHY